MSTMNFLNVPIARSTAVAVISHIHTCVQFDFVAPIRNQTFVAYTFLTFFFSMNSIHSVNDCFFLPCSQTDGNGGPDEVQLDAEMEKVFAGPVARENKQDRFDVAQLIGDTEAKERDAQRFKDYDSDCKCFSMLFVHFHVFFLLCRKNFFLFTFHSFASFRNSFSLINLCAHRKEKNR